MRRNESGVHVMVLALASESGGTSAGGCGFANSPRPSCRTCRKFRVNQWWFRPCPHITMHLQILPWDRWRPHAVLEGLVVVHMGPPAPNCRSLCVIHRLRRSWRNTTACVTCCASRPSMTLVKGPLLPLLVKGAILHATQTGQK